MVAKLDLFMTPLDEQGEILHKIEITKKAWGENNAWQDGENNIEKPPQRTGEHPRNSRIHEEEVQGSYTGAKRHKSYHPSMAGNEADSQSKIMQS